MFAGISNGEMPRRGETMTLCDELLASPVSKDHFLDTRQHLFFVDGQGTAGVE